MSPKKIDTEALVKGIFKDTPVQKKKLFSNPSKGRLNQEALLSALGGEKTSPKASFTEQTRSALSGVWKNEFAGIDIGNDAVKFVLLSQEKNRLCLKDVQIERFARFDRPEDANEFSKEVAASLAKIAARVRPKTKVAVALNDPALYMDFVSVPRGSEDELREAVRKQIAEQRLIEPKACFFDYTVLNGLEPSSGIVYLLVVAAPQELVYQRLQWVEQTGFKVLAVESNALATIQALERARGFGREDRALILDVGARYTALSVFIGSKLTLTRIIPIAGERFTASLAKALGVNQQRAEQLKVKYGLASEAEPEGSEAVKVGRVLKEEIDKLLMEINRSLEFAFSKVGGEGALKINTLFVFGGSAGMKGLKAYLAQKLNAQAGVVNLWQGLQVDHRLIQDEFLNENQDSISVSLGLALRVTDWNVLPFGLGMPG